MTTITYAPRDANALLRLQAFKEEPGVKKLTKRHPLVLKEVFSGISGIAIDVAAFTVVWACLTLIAVHGAALSNVSVGWTVTGMVVLAMALLSQFLKPLISWTFNSPHSPLFIHREHKATVQKTRRLAKKLGSAVVPVLTEAHVTVIHQLHMELLVAAEAGYDGIKGKPGDYDRLAVLLLEDLKREATLRSLITERRLSTMDDIEAALREIEADTSGPVQSGWL